MRASIEVAIAAGGLCAACSSVRYVQRTAGGGTVAVRGARTEQAMAEARDLMARHCAGAYRVVDEREVAFGQAEWGRQETRQTKRGTTVTHGHQASRERTEWQITYQCGAAQP